MKPNASFVAILVVGSSSLAGCTVPTEADDDVVGVTQQAETEDNGLDTNGFTNNGFTNNGFTNNGLISTGLISNNLYSTTAFQNISWDTVTQKFFKYVVGCALSPNQTVTVTLDGVDYTFSGSLGIAPAWGTAACNAACQQRVSACVMARVNYLGQTVLISLRNSSLLTTTPAEETAFPYVEGAYYGNIFTSPQVHFACKARGNSLISRSCGPDLTHAFTQIVGNCEDVCSYQDPDDGSFSGCLDSNNNVVNDVVTVYRQ
jgi:hypothetical protein